MGKLIIIGAAAVLFLAGSPPSGSQEAVPLPTWPSGKEYTEAVGAIEATVGEEFSIVLDSNRTTGFSWQFAESWDGNILEWLGTEYREPEVRRKGAGGKEVMRFRAAGPGTVTVSVKYSRPWESAAEPARKLDFVVTVR